MTLDVLLANLTSPALLFFLLGLFAVYVKSDLSIPENSSKFISLYLLFSIGFKGGQELSHEHFTWEIASSLLFAVALSAAIPVWVFYAVRKRLGVANASAVAASYGSVSAVTFVAAVAFLESLGHILPGHMVATMALMESPAIIVGLLLVKLAAPARKQRPGAEGMQWGVVLNEAFLNSSVFLLVGSLLIGVLVAGYSPHSVEKMLPFTDKLFYGVLSFFLLDMGIVAAQRLSDLRKAGPFLIGFAVLMPLLNAFLGVLIAKGLGLDHGNALLFVVLCASASYIAVPAAMRMTVPEANPSLYISTALGVTFPFNIIVGIPAYMALVNKLIPAAS